MARVSLIQEAREARDGGGAPLYLMVRHRSERARLALGVVVRPADWNAVRMRVRGRDAEATNARLSAVLAAAEAEVTALTLAPDRTVTAAAIRDRLRALVQGSPLPDQDAPDLLAYADAMVRGYEARGQFGTWESYRAQVDKLRRYAAEQGFTRGGAPRLAFEAVTPAFARAFYTFLLTPETEGGVGNRLNTARKAITTVRMIHRRAIQDGLAPPVNPWEAVTPRQEKARKTKLTVDEVRAFAALDLPPGPLRNTRDWWLIAFYAGGMRFGDVAQMTREQLVEDGRGDWRVFYRMSKTGDPHGVLLVPEALAVLDRCAPGWREASRSDARQGRVLPILDGYDLSTARALHQAIGARNAKVNTNLGRIAKRLGLKAPDGTDRRIGFHLSRHSLAGYLLESGTDVRTIQKVLGHKTLRDTEVYLAGFDHGRADEAMRGIRL